MHNPMHDSTIGCHVHCEGCGESVRLPNAAVRLTGRLGCSQGHTFNYDAKHFYKPNGELRVPYRQKGA